MAVLGVGGRLVLRRPAPDPCFISPQDLLDWNSNQLLDFCPGYLSGDRVQAVGLPIDVNGIPIKPEGWSMYEGGDGHWYLGENRDHISDEYDQFYKAAGEEFPVGQAGDDADFYAKEGDLYRSGHEIPEDPENEYFIHVDSHTGYASFYEDRCYALQGCPQRRVNLWNVGLPMAIGPYGSATYNNAVAECFADWGEYRYSGVDDNSSGISICRDFPLYTNPEAGTEDYDNADIIPRGTATKGYIWEVVCGVREWNLALSAPEVDTTSVSEKFGEAVKSLVSGGGSLEFFIDRECLEEGTTNGIPLMELLLMTDKNAEAEAEFWMMTQEQCDELCWGGACGPIDKCIGKIGGSLYYESNILITQTSVNVRPTELVVGTANFVTTGEIKLLQEPYGPVIQLPSSD